MSVCVYICMCYIQIQSAVFFAVFFQNKFIHHITYVVCLSLAMLFLSFHLHTHTHIFTWTTQHTHLIVF